MNIEKKLSRTQYNYSASVAAIEKKLSPLIGFSFHLKWCNLLYNWEIQDEVIGSTAKLDTCLEVIRRNGGLTFDVFLGL